MVGITIVEEEVEMVGMDLVGRGVLYRYMRWYRQKRLCIIILLKVFFFYYILFLFIYVTCITPTFLQLFLLLLYWVTRIWGP